MGEELKAGARITNDIELFMKLSQCVGISAMGHKPHVVGLAHIHPYANHEEMIDSLVEGMTKENCEQGLGFVVYGGYNWYNSGCVMLGKKKADESIDYMLKNGLFVLDWEHEPEGTRIVTAKPKENYVESVCFSSADNSQVLS